MGNEQAAKRALDAYCCEGGASRGYEEAGFSVEGVDLFEEFTQARYPYPSARGDAIEWINEHGNDYDLIHASPPCQHASISTSALRGRGKKYVELIAPTRLALIKTGRPYVIENVRGSRLHNPIKLCGCMFDLTALDEDGLPLRMERERWFEFGGGIKLTAPRECSHDPDVWVAGSYGGSRRQGNTPAERRFNAKYVRRGGYVPGKEVQEKLMGIDWMTQKGLHQALPPAYTRWIGQQIMEQIR